MKDSRGPSFFRWVKDRAAEFGSSFASLKGAPKELWVVYSLKFLESYAYFSQSYIFVIFLSDEFGMSDSQAGWIYGMCGLLTSVYGILIGFLVDNLGVKLSLVVGAVCLTVARLAMALTHVTWLLFAILGTLLPFGSALGIPVMSTGIRRYTTPSNRAFAFSLFYVVMNVSALLAGVLVDALRYALHVDDKDPTRPPVSSLSGYRWILLTGASANLIMLFVAVFAVREISVSETGEAASFQPKRGTPWAIAWEIITTASFWRFILFVVLLIGVRFVFRHLDLTLPKYLLREVSPTAPYGSIIAINPFIIIFLVPVVSAFYHTRSTAFECILAGSAVSACSVYFMLFGPHYWNAIAFVALLSVGEAMWSPRLFEYMTTIAPEGREGTYSALATAPTFVASLGVGAISGMLLDQMCPVEGVRHCSLMWLIIALTTSTSPILMFLLRNVIHKEALPALSPLPDMSAPAVLELKLSTTKLVLADASRDGEKDKDQLLASWA